MARILLAGLLAGLAMFLWEMTTHMALPIGEMGMSTLPNEQAVRQTLAAQLGQTDGLYFFPDLRGGGEPTPGPWGLFVYHPQWNFSWSVLGWEALVELTLGLALALLIALAGPASFARRMGLSLLVGVMAALAVSPGYTIWYGFPMAFTAGQMIVAFGDFLVGGLVVAALLRSRPAAAAAA